MTETAVIDPPTTTLSPLQELILVRLLPAAKSRPSPSALRTALSQLFRRTLSTEDIAAALNGLRSEALLTPRGQNLTDAGRARALAYLGIAELPAKLRWSTLVARHLVPKALGVSQDSPESLKLASHHGNLAAALLKRKYGLPIGSGSSVTEALEALVCQRLGYPDQIRLNDLAAVILSRELNSDKVLTKGEIAHSAPEVLLQAPKKGMDGLRLLALAGLLNPGRPPEPIQHPEEFDLEAFANTVLSAARGCPTGRFGDNKVFINHVWRQLETEKQFAGLGLSGFKQKLVDANRERLLTLSRADLVQVMDPADVRDSETEYLNAVFHFVLLERA